MSGAAGPSGSVETTDEPADDPAPQGRSSRKRAASEEEKCGNNKAPARESVMEALAGGREPQATLQGGTITTLRRVDPATLDGVSAGVGESSAFMFTREQYPKLLPSHVTLDPDNPLLLNWSYLKLLPPSWYAIVFELKSGTFRAVPEHKLSLEGYPAASRSVKDAERIAGFDSKSKLRLVLYPNALRFFWLGLDQPLRAGSVWPTTTQIMMCGFKLSTPVWEALNNLLPRKGAWATAFCEVLCTRHMPQPSPPTGAPPAPQQMPTVSAVIDGNSATFRALSKAEMEEPQDDVAPMRGTYWTDDERWGPVDEDDHPAAEAAYPRRGWLELRSHFAGRVQFPLKGSSTCGSSVTSRPFDFPTEWQWPLPDGWTWNVARRLKIDPDGKIEVATSKMDAHQGYRRSGSTAVMLGGTSYPCLILDRRPLQAYRADWPVLRDSTPSDAEKRAIDERMAQDPEFAAGAARLKEWHERRKAAGKAAREAWEAGDKTDASSNAFSAWRQEYEEAHERPEAYIAEAARVREAAKAAWEETREQQSWYKPTTTQHAVERDCCFVQE